MSRPSASSAAGSGALPLSFRRSGGLAGLDEQASISTDGSVTVTRGGTGSASRHLDDDVFAQLEQRLAAIPSTGPSPMASGTETCADGYVYRIRTPSWSAVTDDCSRQDRPALDSLLTLLTPLLRQNPVPASAASSPPQ